MTTEVWQTQPSYTVAGTGPYAVENPYGVGDLVVAAISADGVRTVLSDPADYSVTPTSSATTGDVYLTSGAATTHAGATLFIARLTDAEQGWLGASAREKGLEAQLDLMTRATQELQAGLAKTARSDAPMAPLVPVEGATLIWENGNVVAGPTVAEISGVQAAADAAAASAATASAAVTAADLSADAAATSALAADASALAAAAAQDAVEGAVATIDAIPVKRGLAFGYAAPDLPDDFVSVNAASMPILLGADLTFTWTGSIATGKPPKKVLTEIVCVTAELGHAIGDVIEIAPGSGHDATSPGFSIRKANDTFSILVASAGLARICNRSTWQMALITPANWKLRFLVLQ